VRTKVYEDYIRDNVANWFEWSRNDGLPVERLEDLILVTGCTLVTSWAVATFIDDTQEISLAVQALPNGRGKFDWSRMRGNVPHHNSQHDPVRPSCWLLSLTMYRLLFFVANGEIIPDTGPVRLHQGLPSKTPLVVA
jgi:hypothetical protein